MRYKLFILIITIILILTSCGAGGEARPSLIDDLDNHVSQELFIPELIDVTADQSEYELTVDETSFEFFKGYPTTVKSYNNQGYLGKTLKVKRGSTFYPKITNNLDEVTTVHWHGLEVTGENDGAAGMIAKVAPGSSRIYELAVDQHASTIWYHPHAMGYTASQVYEGLAGMMIIVDDEIDQLGLPDDYGINDIPLILQAKVFDEVGNLAYNHPEYHDALNDEGGIIRTHDSEKKLKFEDGNGTNEESTKGFMTITNGQYKPYLNVKNELIRFRVLNGSNHGIYDLTMNDGSTLQLIATDGGLLEQPQAKEVIGIAASQRFEIIVDLSDKKVGDQVILQANGQVVLTLKVTEDVGKSYKLPEELSEIDLFEAYNGQDASHIFVLENDLINNQPFDMNTINYEFSKNQVYYFYVINNSYENHSFHIHNAQFLVVEKDDQPADYKSIGWKDTIYLKSNESMKIQVKFRFTGDYMYHCHILMHEEDGMMGKFRVVD